MAIAFTDRIKPRIENGTFELGYGTAASTVEKRQSTRALQQRIQPKRNIPNTASWICCQ